jgi:hypothetical protein
MSDTTVTSDAPVLDLPKEAPLPNTPEARTPDGTIKDQSTPSTTPTPNPDQATDQTKKPEDTAKAPETYADFKVPEGVTLKPEALKEVTPLFKELGLNQDQAQKLVDWYGKDLKIAADAPKREFDTMVDGWRVDVLNDSSLASGDDLRPDVKESIGRLKSTLPSTERAEFEKLMNMSGLGNHPTIVRALNAWGKSLGEGKHVAGNGPSPEGQKAPGTPAKPSIAAAMFPNLPQR